ncbi:Nesprin-2-like [Scleropages formosus]|uniref:Nesprin-2-like n=1 Tax=Scleropages formosus TaxID=113540 RepID=A0A0P7V1Z4_SCLFO|nr:Nesprin-2-like [Scleropages formosus]
MANVDVRDPDEKSIMTYVAQFLQYSKDLPMSEEDMQMHYLSSPKCLSPVNLPTHFTPAIGVSPFRQASAGQKAREVTCWLVQAYDELLEGWISTEGESYAERYQLTFSSIRPRCNATILSCQVNITYVSAQVFQTFLVSFNEQRRPVMPLLTAMRRTPQLSEEQKALRKAWDALAEKLREYKTELDVSLPAPLDSVGRWLLRVEGALAQEERETVDHSRAAKETHDKLDLLKTSMEAMGAHLRTFQTFNNMDECGAILVPTDKLEEIKRRFTSIRVTAKYHSIKLEYQEHRHTVLDLLGQINTKLRLWRRPYSSQEAVHVLLQDWQDTVNKKDLVSLLEATLLKMKLTADKYTSKSALDSKHISRQVKEAEAESATCREALLAIRVSMGHALSTWDSYQEDLTSLRAWLEQEAQSHSPSKLEVTPETISEWSAVQTRVNELGTFLSKVMDAQMSRILSDELRRVNSQWADFIQRAKLKTVSQPSHGLINPQAVQALLREAAQLIKEPVDVLSGPLRTYRKRLQFMMKRIEEVDMDALSPSPECSAELLQRLTLSIPEVMHTLRSAESVCEELQVSVSGLDSRLAELQHWECEAKELYHLLREEEHRQSQTQDPRVRELISQALQLEGQVVTEEQDLQVMVMTAQKSSPLQYLIATVMQEREAVGMLSSLGSRQAQSPTGDQTLAQAVQPQVEPQPPFLPEDLTELCTHEEAQHPPKISITEYKELQPLVQVYNNAQDLPHARDKAVFQSQPHLDRQSVHQPPVQAHAQTKGYSQTSSVLTEPNPHSQPLIPSQTKDQRQPQAQSQIQDQPKKARVSTRPWANKKSQGQASSKPHYQPVPQTQTSTQDKAQPKAPAKTYSENKVQPKPQPKAQPQINKHAKVQMQAVIKPKDENHQKAQSQPQILPQTSPWIPAKPQVQSQAQSQVQTQLLAQPLMIPHTKVPVLAQAPLQAYTEAYAKAQALARDRFEEAKHCLQDHILETIMVFNDRGISEEQANKKEEALRTLDPELLDEFLRAAEGMEAFCSPAQLRDMEFFTQSVRTQWEACFSEEGSLLQAGHHLEALRELCDTLSPEDAHRLAQAQLRECERRLAAIQRQFSSDRDIPPSDLGYCPEHAENEMYQKESDLLSGPPYGTEVTFMEAGLEKSQLNDPITTKDISSKEEMLKSYQDSRTALQAKLASNEQCMPVHLPSDSASSAVLHVKLQELQHLEQDTEVLWLDFKLQCSQCSQFKDEQRGVEEHKAEMEQKWEKQKTSLQGSIKSLKEALEVVDSVEDHIRCISERFEHITGRPRDISTFSPSDANTLQDVKSELHFMTEQDLDKSIQQEMEKLVDNPLSSLVQGCRKCLDELRQRVRKCEAATQALDRFLVSLHTMEQEIGTAWANPSDDAISLRDCRSRLALVRQSIRSVADKAPQLDQLLKGAVLAVTRNGIPASCVDVVVVLEKKLEETDAGLIKKQQSFQREQEGRAVGLRRRTLQGALCELQAVAERQGLKEPTIPAVQQRLRALNDLQNRLDAHQTELQNLQDASMPLTPEVGLSCNPMAELNTQWEDSQRAVKERLDQCSVLMELLKKFQNCRSHLSNTLQRGEQTIAEQASYMGKDNLQRLITKVQGIKDDLASLGDGVEEIRVVCRQLQLQLKKIPDCVDAPFESEANALVDRWLDVSEKTDTHMDNLRLALEVWEKLLLLGGEIESWAGRKMAIFVESHPFQSEQEITIMQGEIKSQEENIEHFHRKSTAIQDVLQSKESPLELQVMETQLRKKMEQVKELFSDSSEVFQELILVKESISERMSECQASLRVIQYSLNMLHASDEPQFLSQLEVLSAQLQAQAEHADGLLQEVSLLSSVASPQALEALAADGVRLKETVHATRELIGQKREQAKTGFRKGIHEECQAFEEWFQDLQLSVNECFENPERCQDLQVSLERLAAFLSYQEGETRLGCLKEKVTVVQEQLSPHQAAELHSWLEEQEQELATFRTHCRDRHSQLEALVHTLDRFVHVPCLRSEGLLQDTDVLLERYSKLQETLHSQREAQRLSRETQAFQTLADSIQAWVKDLQQQTQALGRGSEDWQTQIEKVQDLLSIVSGGDAKLQDLRRTGEKLLEQRGLEDSRRREVLQLMHDIEQEWKALVQSAEDLYSQAEAKSILAKDNHNFQNLADSTLFWIRDLQQQAQALERGNGHSEALIEERLQKVQTLLGVRTDGDTRLQNLRRSGQELSEQQVLEEGRREVVLQTVCEVQQEWRAFVEFAEELHKQVKAQNILAQESQTFQAVADNTQVWVRDLQQQAQALSREIQDSQTLTEELLRKIQVFLNVKEEGDVKLQDLMKSGEQLLKQQGLEDSRRSEVLQLVHDIEKEWKACMQSAEDLHNQAEVQSAFVRQNQDFQNLADTTQVWVRDLQKQARALGKGGEESKIPNEELLKKIQDLKSCGKELSEQQNLQESRKEEVLQVVHDIDEEWSAVLQSAEELYRQAEARCLLAQEVEAFQALADRMRVWVRDLQQQAEALDRDTKDSQVQIEEGIQKVQAFCDLRDEGEAKLQDMMKRWKELSEHQDLQESNRSEVLQTVHDVEQEWNTILQSAKDLRNKIEAQNRLFQDISAFETLVDSTGAWIRDLQQQVQALDEGGERSQAETEQRLQEVQALLDFRDDGDAKLRDLRKQGQELSEQQDLQESKRKEVLQMVRDAEQEWNTVLQYSQDLQSKVEAQNLLAQESHAFQNLVDSTRAWIRGLQQEAKALDKGSEGSQAQLEERLQKAQVILGVRAEGDTQLQNLRRSGEQLLEQHRQEENRKLILQTVCDAEQEWNTVLQAAEQLCGVLQGVVERSVGCLCQKEQARACVEQLRHQTAELPLLFPWPGLGDRRQTTEQAQCLLDRTAALAPTLSALRTQATELFQLTKDPSWMDPCWAALEENAKALLDDLEVVCRQLEEGIQMERQCAQLVEQHSLAQDWLRDQVHGIDPLPDSRQDLQNIVNTLKALLQTAAREEREMRQLVAAKDFLWNQCTHSGQTALAAEVDRLLKLQASSDREVRDQLRECELRLQELDERLANKAQTLREEAGGLQRRLLQLSERLAYRRERGDLNQLQQYWESLKECEGMLTELGVQVDNLQLAVRTEGTDGELPTDIISATTTLALERSRLSSVLSELLGECAKDAVHTLREALQALQQWIQSTRVLQPTESAYTVGVCIEEGKQLQVALKKVRSHCPFLRDSLGVDQMDRMEKDCEDVLSEGTARICALTQSLQDLAEKDKQELKKTTSPPLKSELIVDEETHGEAVKDRVSPAEAMGDPLTHLIASVPSQATEVVPGTYELTESHPLDACRVTDDVEFLRKTSKVSDKCTVELTHITVEETDAHHLVPDAVPTPVILNANVREADVQRTHAAVPEKCDSTIHLAKVLEPEALNTEQQSRGTDPLSAGHTRETDQDVDLKKPPFSEKDNQNLESKKVTGLVLDIGMLYVQTPETLQPVNSETMRIVSCGMTGLDTIWSQSEKEEETKGQDADIPGLTDAWDVDAAKQQLCIQSTSVQHTQPMDTTAVTKDQMPHAEKMSSSAPLEDTEMLQGNIPLSEPIFVQPVEQQQEEHLLDLPTETEKTDISHFCKSESIEETGSILPLDVQQSCILLDLKECDRETGMSEALHLDTPKATIQCYEQENDNIFPNSDSEPTDGGPVVSGPPTNGVQADTKQESKPQLFVEDTAPENMRQQTKCEAAGMQDSQNKLMKEPDPGPVAPPRRRPKDRKAQAESRQNGNQESPHVQQSGEVSTESPSASREEDATEAMSDGDAPKESTDGLGASWRDLEARLSRAMLRVLRCQNRPAEVDADAMSQQVEEAEASRLSVQEQVVLLKNHQAAEGWASKTKQLAETQWDVFLLDAEAIMSTKERHLQLIAQYQQQTQAVKATLQRLPADLDALKAREMESSSSKAEELQLFLRNMEQERIILGDLLQTQVQILPHLSHPDRVVVQIQLISLQKEWKTIEMSVEASLHRFSVLNQAVNSLLLETQDLQHQMKTLKKSLEPGQSASSKWNSKQAGELLIVGADLTAVNQHYLHLQQIAEALVQDSLGEQEMRSISLALQGVKDELDQLQLSTQMPISSNTTLVKIMKVIQEAFTWAKQIESNIEAEKKVALLPEEVHRQIKGLKKLQADITAKQIQLESLSEEVKELTPELEEEDIPMVQSLLKSLQSLSCSTVEKLAQALQDVESGLQLREKMSEQIADVDSWVLAHVRSEATREDMSEKCAADLEHRLRQIQETLREADKQVAVTEALMMKSKDIALELSIDENCYLNIKLMGLQKEIKSIICREKANCMELEDLLQEKVSSLRKLTSIENSLTKMLVDLKKCEFPVTKDSLVKMQPLKQMLLEQRCQFPLIKRLCQEAMDQLQGIALDLYPSQLNSEKQWILQVTEVFSTWELTLYNNVQILEWALLKGLHYPTEHRAALVFLEQVDGKVQQPPLVCCSVHTIDWELRRCTVLQSSVESRMRVLEALKHKSGAGQKGPWQSSGDLDALRGRILKACHQRVAREVLKEYGAATKAIVGLLQDAERALLPGSVIRCAEKQGVFRKRYEDILQKLKLSEASLSERMCEKNVSHNDLFTCLLKALEQEVDSLEGMLVGLREWCSEQGCAGGRKELISTTWRRWTRLQCCIRNLRARSEQRSQEWKDVDKSVERATVVLEQLQGEFPGPPGDAASQEDLQEQLVQTEQYLVQLDCEHRALAALELRVARLLGVPAHQEQTPPIPLCQKLQAMQDRYRTLKERSMRSRRAAHMELQERERLKEEIQGIHEWLLEALSQLSVVDQTQDQTPSKQDLQYSEMYTLVPLEIGGELQEVSHTLQEVEKKVVEEAVERNSPLRRLTDRRAEVQTGLQSVLGLLEQRCPTVAEAESLQKRVWDKLDHWHTCLAALEAEAQDLSEEQPEEARQLTEKLMETLQLYQRIAQQAEQRTSLLSKIHTSLKEHEEMIQSSNTWLSEAQSWMVAPSTYTTAKCLSSHVSLMLPVTCFPLEMISMILNDSEQMRRTLHGFLPVLEEMSAVCDTAALVEQLTEADQRVAAMQQRILGPLSQLERTVVVSHSPGIRARSKTVTPAAVEVETFESVVKKMEKSLNEIRSTVSTRDAAILSPGEQLGDLQAALSSLQSMRSTIVRIQSGRQGLFLPVGAEETLGVFHAANQLQTQIQSLELEVKERSAALQATGPLEKKSEPAVTPSQTPPIAEQVLAGDAEEGEIHVVHVEEDALKKSGATLRTVEESTPQQRQSRLAERSTPLQDILTSASSEEQAEVSVEAVEDGSGGFEPLSEGHAKELLGQSGLAWRGEEYQPTGLKTRNSGARAANECTSAAPATRTHTGAPLVAGNIHGSVTSLGNSEPEGEELRVALGPPRIVHALPWDMETDPRQHAPSLVTHRQNSIVLPTDHISKPQDTPSMHTLLRDTLDNAFSMYMPPSDKYHHAETPPSDTLHTRMLLSNMPSTHILPTNTPHPNSLPSNTPQTHTQDSGAHSLSRDETDGMPPTVSLSKEYVAPISALSSLLPCAVFLPVRCVSTAQVCRTRDSEIGVCRIENTCKSVVGSILTRFYEMKWNGHRRLRQAEVREDCGTSCCVDSSPSLLLGHPWQPWASAERNSLSLELSNLAAIFRKLLQGPAERCPTLEELQAYRHQAAQLECWLEGARRSLGALPPVAGMQDSIDQQLLTCQPSRSVPSHTLLHYLVPLVSGVPAAGARRPPPRSLGPRTGSLGSAQQVPSRPFHRLL